MKKTILMLIAISCFASTAFATYVAVQDGTTLGSAAPTLTVKGSKGVQIEYGADTTAGQGYVLGAYHTSGTQTYASSSGDTKIYKQDGTGVATPTAIPTGSNTANFSAWTAM
jgi:hypothetical protein